MDNHGFIQFVLYKLISLSVELTLLYILVLLCEWFAVKKGYNIFERSFLVTLVTLPIVTLIIWTIIIARFKLF
ncbi:hypothetical protein J7E81_07835 [Bacillus sp. ISL-18]|uniref:hypothetical protein n=1 Tax=Bacillus sp. ISL-18 TaxID=2819118 RepID=UPI001BE622A9|nr:hypothetical protein [Bacillus sp. ISL-18]MBT2655151.1 hypothetical protein [Bacillus sp. ISL-18]